MLAHTRVNEWEIELVRQGAMLVDATIFASDKIHLEAEAVRQLADGAAIPGVRRVLATPDIHQGYGVPIGSVIGTQGTVIPAAVGFDINCGMRVLTTNLTAAGSNINALALAIRSRIPLGEGKSNISLSAGDLDQVLAGGVRALASVKRKGHAVWEQWDAADEIRSLAHMEDEGSMPGDPAAVSARAQQRGRDQLGSLGGGNHFVELQTVEAVLDGAVAQRFGLFPGQLLVMIHSGSRGLGHQVGDEYMRRAAASGIRSPVPCLDADSRDGRAYLGAMRAAANFAFTNRHLIGLLTRAAIRSQNPDARVALLYDVPHNIAKFERHGDRTLLVHRKGATRAFGPRRLAGSDYADTGQPVLIPGSMGTASYILSGVDTAADTLASVNHGAGRVMSRTEARGKWQGKKMLRPPAISEEAFERAMRGVILHCESRRGVVEEAPQAYKDIDLVMETVLGAGLANAVVRTRPLAVLKG